MDLKFWLEKKQVKRHRIRRTYPKKPNVQHKSISFHEYRKEKFFSGKSPKYTGFTPPSAIYYVLCMDS